MTDEELAARVAGIIRRPYHRVIRGEPVEGYVGEVPELPGCLTGGDTPEETLKNLEEAMAVWLEVAILRGADIPHPAAGLVQLTG